MHCCVLAAMGDFLDCFLDNYNRVLKKSTLHQSGEQTIPRCIEYCKKDVSYALGSV
jgi:hypothetical protein